MVETHDETPIVDLAHPGSIARKGEEIYRQKYKVEYEHLYPGMFAAIDVTTGEAYLGDLSGHAIKAGEDASPNGLFYLIRIGQDSAFVLHTFMRS